MRTMEEKATPGDERAKLKRFGRLVSEQRRGEGLTPQEVHGRGGPSAKRLLEIEAGTAPMPRISTLRKIEKGLGLKPNCASKALHGDGVLVPEKQARKQTYTEEDVQRRVELARALDRAGITGIATRNPGSDGEFRLPAEIIDQLISILNSLPDSRHD